MKASTLATVIDGAVALAIIASSTVLIALDKIDAPTALSLMGVAVVLVGGSAKALLALHVPAPTQAVSPPAAPAPAQPAAVAPAPVQQ